MTGSCRRSDRFRLNLCLAGRPGTNQPRDYTLFGELRQNVDHFPDANLDHTNVVERRLGPVPPSGSRWG